MKLTLIKAFLLVVVPLILLAGVGTRTMVDVQHVVARPTSAPAPLPTSSVQYGSTSPVKAWKPRIAFQYYDRDYPDAEFMATKFSWLMMRYGAEAKRQQVYDKGYDGLILQYMLAYQVLGPGPYKDKNDDCTNDHTPLRNNASWTKDFCGEVHPHEEWFLHNGKGERIVSKWNNWDGTSIYSYFMNPGSKGFRNFWIAQVKRQSKAGWRGFFLDNVAVDYNYLRLNAGNNSDRKVQEYDSVEAWQTNLTGFIKEMHKNFPGYPIWANMIETDAQIDAWSPLFNELDGFMEENFATNWIGQEPFAPAVWESMLARADQALKRGKGVVFYSQGTQNETNRMRFGLASYLLVATVDNRATFRFADSHDYLSLWWYPEYDMNLGLPKGERYQVGEQWIRDFQCGRVVVTPGAQRGTIEQHACHP